MPKPSHDVQRVLGVDVGGTSSRVAVIEDGAIVFERQWLTQRETLHSFCRRIADELNRIQYESTGSEPAAIGMGMRGIIDLPSQRFVSGSLFTAAGECDLVSYVSEATGLPVLLSNDVDAAGLGIARWEYPGKSFTFINVGTGIGASIFDEGRLTHRGVQQHTELADYVLVGDDGRFRDLESVVSGAGLDRQVKEYSTRYPESLVLDVANDGEPTPQVLRRALERDDALARIVVDGFVRALAMAIVNIESLTGSHLYVIGGGVFRDGAWLIERVNAELSRICMSVGVTCRARAVLTQLDIDRIGLIGAGALAEFSDIARLGFNTKEKTQ